MISRFNLIFKTKNMNKNEEIDLSYWAAFGELRTMAERPKVLEPEVEFWEGSFELEPIFLEEELELKEI